MQRCSKRVWRLLVMLLGVSIVLFGAVALPAGARSTDATETEQEAPEVAGDSATNSQAQAETRHFSRQIDLDISADQAGAVEALLPTSYSVDEDGFVGSIPFTGYSTIPYYESVTSQIDRMTVYDGLTSNDVDLLPESATFEVSSDSAPGATQEATLQRAAVAYAVTAVDETGLPTSYSAAVTYRGLQSALHTTGYHVTAIYEGDLATTPAAETVTTAPAVQAIPTPAADLAVEKTAASGVAESASEMNPLAAFIQNNAPALISVFCIALFTAFLAIGISIRRQRIDTVGSGR